MAAEGRIETWLLKGAEATFNTPIFPFSTIYNYFAIFITLERKTKIKRKLLSVEGDMIKLNQQLKQVEVKDFNTTRHTEDVDDRLWMIERAT